MSLKPSMRTPLSRVRYLGSAHSGTEHFWKQRVSSVALVFLTIAFIIILIGLLALIAGEWGYRRRRGLA